MLCVTQTCYTTGMEEMPKIQYLIRRRQTWYVRLRIPVDLLELYKPKKEFLRSLQTRDYKEALKRLSPAKAEIEAEFEARRKQLSAQNDQSDILAAYSDHELIQLTRKWFSDMRAAEDVRRIKGQGRWTEERKREYHIELQQEESAARDEVLGLSEREEHMGMTLAGKFLKAEGISYQPSSENMDKLAYFFSKAIHELAQASLKEFEGKLPLGGSISAIGPYSSGFTPTKVVTMGALFDEYLADPSRKRQASTLKNYTIIRRAVDEVIGSNTPVHKVTRRDCRALQEFLLLLPANAVKKTQANTLKEAIKIAETQNLPRSADTTVNMHLQKLNAVMSYAIREGYINYHPAQGMYVQEIMKSNARRLPFDADQVNKIFNAPLYTGCKDDMSGYNKPGTAQPRRARFWVPLISLWTGMRLNEICQLLTTDIAVQDGIEIILIQIGDEAESGDDEEKRVKTEAGIRFVPVHPMLKRIGFLDFVLEQQEAGHKRLFPEIKTGPLGNHSHGMSKWFGNFLENIGAKKKRTSFHSFRHLYRDAVREAELPLDATLQLGGWSRGTTDADYGSGLKAQTLHEHICKISYPDLDLSHLYK